MEPAIKASTERARVTQSSALAMLHELGHRDRLMFPQYTTGKGEEERVVNDVDRAIEGHPGIGRRYQYQGVSPIGKIEFVDLPPGEHPTKQTPTVLWPKKEEILTGQRK